MTLTEWCKGNCANAWGWFFDKDEVGYLGFADKDEMFLFCISNDYLHS